MTNSGNVARAVVDGAVQARWESVPSDPQWISVDLEQATSVARAVLKWESAYAKGFDLQVSSDNATWRTVYSTSTNTSTTTITFPTTTARYVRVNCAQRATPYAYSMYEFEVYAN